VQRIITMKWLPKSLHTSLLPITMLVIATFPVSALLYVNQVPDHGDRIQQESTQNELKEQIPAEETKAGNATIRSQRSQQNAENVPDFSAYANVRQKKQAFFEFMLPLIRKANTSIREERAELEYMVARLDQNQSLSPTEHQRVNKLFKQYRFKVPFKVQAADVEELLERVDIVPASLVLAQAANESGWGTSRFATEANNYFGVWCFTTGCGVEPRNRDDGLTHEVAYYGSVQEGVSAYIHNINTHGAYEVLRMIRAEQRYSQNHYMGFQLADGLVHYSARGEEYVLEIQQMIRTNNLHEYTLPTPSSA
jgi:Bax protein